MSEPGAKILVVEDDEAIAEGLALNLKLEGLVPIVASDGEAALARVADERPALVLLDISLPRKSGLDVLGEMREAGDRTPIIVLSARQDEHDKVAALRLGADDYVTKPFGVAELLARIDAVLRRIGERKSSTADRAEPVFHFADVAIDLATREIARAGKPVPMTHLEFELVTFFLKNPTRVLSRQKLLREVWGVSHGGSARTVDNFVAQLRAKFEEDPGKPRHFVTIRGSGYRFDP